MGRFDMLGAAPSDDLKRVEVASRRDAWIATAATFAGGAAGALLFRNSHPVLGLLNGFAVGGNAARVATGEIPVRRAAENLAAHALATAGSLALPSHPAAGYVVGAAVANIFIRREDSYLERLDETILGERASKVRALLGPKIPETP